ncbi:MAG: hypothetical protein K0S47_3883 [Herbinix sp.]|jgi:hypothetical protein|nr:hypothetical protein [Herbinix sp.]
MNRKTILITTLLLLLITVAVTSLIIGNHKSESSINQNEEEINQIIKKAGSLNLMVDPRIELLSAVQLISDYNRLTNLNFSYYNEMEEYFRDYKNHAVVKKFKSMRDIGYSYDAPPTSMLYLSNPPALEQKIDFDTNLMNRAGNERNLISFIQNLRDFTMDSDFKGFYEQNYPFYQSIVDTVYDNIKDMDITKALDDYYGMKVNSYNIILAPMLHSGGYGPRIKRENGLYDVYGILGPVNTSNGQNGQILPDFSVETIRYLAWHEFSHSFVNPTTEKYIDEINQYSDLYTYISSFMEAQSYPQWEICVNEHIVRAVTTRLTYLYEGDEAGDRALGYEKSQGFYYIEALCDSLKIYEENRDKYPTFESYYPELVNVFKTLLEQGVDISMKFNGPINFVFNFQDLDMVIIVPTNEDDKTTQEDISKSVEIIKSQFFPEADIIEDVDALQKDLSNYVILAYGTMDGNLWLQEYKETFPFQVESDRIVADKEYKDTDQILISALPNPQNSNHPLLVYTAQKAEDVVNINAINHGGTDYVIGKDGKEITSGYYEKEKDIWEFKH